MLNRKVLDSNLVLIKNTGLMLKIVSLIFLLPVLTIPFYSEEWKLALIFIGTSLFTYCIGVLLAHIKTSDHSDYMSIGQDSVFVVGIWIMVSLISAIPFMIGMKMTFTHAVFESVSGWTTTGLSVVDVTTTPHIFLLYRSIMQFFGGVGLVLILVSALSATFGLRLYNSEGHADRLFPNLLSSSRMILSIYTGYVISGTILYILFGMPPFDAINHSIAALSTGGFSTQPASIGAYNSFSIELITIILMLLGSTNFAVHLMLISGKFKRIMQLGEIRFLVLLLGVAVPIGTFSLFEHTYSNMFFAFRQSLFQLVSALTTTGFQTVPFDDWSTFSVFLVIILMIIGGGVNSTAGGIKYTRMHLLIKSLINSTFKKVKPAHVVDEKGFYKADGKFFMTDENTNDQFNFALLYMIILTMGTLFMTAYGYSLEESFFEFSSALSTVGLSLGLTNAATPNAVLWIQTTGMFLGRLEIVVVFIAIIRVVRDFKHFR